jgi:peptidoglycan hydrolase CwlO-like protein
MSEVEQAEAELAAADRQINRLVEEINILKNALDRTKADRVAAQNKLADSLRAQLNG